MRKTQRIRVVYIICQNYGGPWRSMATPWTSMAAPWNSMETHGHPQEAIEYSTAFFGLPRNGHGIPWISTQCPRHSMAIRGAPRNSMDFHGFLRKSGIFHGKPWNSSRGKQWGLYGIPRQNAVETPWKLHGNSMDLRGNGMELEKGNAMELHGRSVEIEWNLKECHGGF